MESFFILSTVGGLLAFLSICSWAFAREREAAFSAAAALPFNDPEAEAEARRAAILACWRR